MKDVVNDGIDMDVEDMYLSWPVPNIELNLNESLNPSVHNSEY